MTYQQLLGEAKASSSPLIQSHGTATLKSGRLYPLQVSARKKRPLRTRTGRQQFYIDDPWYIEIGESSPIFQRSPVEEKFPLYWNTPHGRRPDRLHLARSPRHAAVAARRANCLTCIPSSESALAGIVGMHVDNRPAALQPQHGAVIAPGGVDGPAAVGSVPVKREFLLDRLLECGRASPSSMYQG